MDSRIEQGQRLRSARKRVPYKSTKKAAEAMSRAGVLTIGDSTLRHYELGTKGFLNNAKALADFYNVSPEWLLYGTNPPAWEKGDENAEETSANLLQHFALAESDTIYSPVLVYNDLIRYIEDNSAYQDFMLQNHKYLTQCLPRFSTQLATIVVPNDRNRPTLKENDIVTVDLKSDPEVDKFALAIINGFDIPIIGTYTYVIEDKNPMAALSFSSPSPTKLILNTVECRAIYRVVSYQVFD